MSQENFQVGTPIAIIKPYASKESLTTDSFVAFSKIVSETKAQAVFERRGETYRFDKKTGKVRGEDNYVIEVTPGMEELVQETQKIWTYKKAYKQAKVKVLELIEDFADLIREDQFDLEKLKRLEAALSKTDN